MTKSSVKGAAGDWTLTVVLNHGGNKVGSVDVVTDPDTFFASQPDLVIDAAGVLLALLVYNLAHSWGKLDSARSTMLSMGCVYPNSAFLGLPVVIQVFGTNAAPFSSLAIMVETSILLPLILLLANRGEQQSLAASLLNSLKNPLIVAILLGIAYAALQIPLPGIGEKVIRGLSAAASGAALFYVGGVMYKLQQQPATGDERLLKPAVMVSLVKLLLYPLVILAMTLLIPGMDKDIIPVLVVIASMPTVGIFPLVASAHGLEAFASTILIVATALSVVTLNSILWFL
jgi:predicted permease